MGTTATICICLPPPAASAASSSSAAAEPRSLLVHLANVGASRAQLLHVLACSLAFSLVSVAVFTGRASEHCSELASRLKGSQ